MNSGKVPPRCTFRQFADVTVECDQDEFGDEAAKAVREAWTDVGVNGLKVEGLHSAVTVYC